MSDISESAKLAYQCGADPLGYAESLLTELIALHLTIAAARIEDPDAFPAYIGGIGPPALARRIIGELLDSGWSMPILRRAT